MAIRLKLTTLLGGFEWRTSMDGGGALGGGGRVLLYFVVSLGPPDSFPSSDPPRRDPQL